MNTIKVSVWWSEQHRVQNTTAYSEHVDNGEAPSSALPTHCFVIFCYGVDVTLGTEQAFAADLGSLRQENCPCYYGKVITSELRGSPALAWFRKL